MLDSTDSPSVSQVCSRHLDDDGLTRFETSLDEGRDKVQQVFPTAIPNDGVSKRRVHHRGPFQDGGLFLSRSS